MGWARWGGGGGGGGRPKRVTLGAAAAMQCNAMQCNAMQYSAMRCNAMRCNGRLLTLSELSSMHVKLTLLKRGGCKFPPVLDTIPARAIVHHCIYHNLRVF